MDSTQSQSVKVPFLDKLKSIPGIFGIHLEEQLKYDLEFREGQKEIRRYAPYFVAQIYVKGTYEEASSEAFSRLLHFLYGSNETESKIPMAAPVFMAPLKVPKNEWMMAFSLPNYFIKSSIPTPQDREIEIIKIPSLKVAVTKYSGKNSEELMKEKHLELLRWVEERDGLKVVSDVRFALYDSPMAIPFMRTNEAHLTIHGE